MAQNTAMTQESIKVVKDVFRELGSHAPNLEDPYYYRIDMMQEWNRIRDPGFHFPRKFHTNFSDETALGETLRQLSPNQGLFRLGWFCDWQILCNYIGGWKREGEEVVISRIEKDTLSIIPGVAICEDPAVRRAILSYSIETLRDQEQTFSATEVPFNMTEYLDQDLNWHKV